MTTSRKALLFAGQGAQFVGMGRDLAEGCPEVKALFSEADDVLGFSISGLCFNGPECELLKTANCQPAVFLVGVACWTALRKRLGVELLPGFSGAAGLSLGEWTALHAAEAVSFHDALCVLRARGRFMQEACEERPGCMLSVIGLSEEQLRDVAEKTGTEIANINSPEQIVLSGEKDRIAEAGKLAASSGAKRTVLLNVAGAYHSSLMASAAEKLAVFLENIAFRVPRIPVVSNVTGLPHDGPEAIRRDMALQVTSPVQWVSCVRWFQRQGVERYVECGPGRVLSGLVRRIHSEASLCNVQDAASLRKTVGELS